MHHCFDPGCITEAARMMLHNGQVDKAILIAEEGTDNSLKAQCYWLKAQKLMAAKSSRSRRAAAKLETDRAKVGRGGTGVERRGDCQSQGRERRDWGRVETDRAKVGRGGTGVERRLTEPR